MLDELLVEHETGSADFQETASHDTLEDGIYFMSIL